MFIATGKAINDSISELKKVVGQNLDYVQFQQKGDSLTLAAIKEPHKMSVTIKVTGDNKAKFAVQTKVITELVSGREGLKFEFDGESKVSFSAIKGKYKGNFITIPFTEVEVIPEDVKSDQKLSPKMQAVLVNIIPRISLQDDVGGELLNIQVIADDKRTVISCLDNNHGSIYVGKSYGKLNLTLPVNQSELLASLIDPKLGEDANLAVNESHLFFWNSSRKVAMPLVATSRDPEEAERILNTKMKYDIRFKTADFSGLVQNFAGLIEENSAIVCDMDGKNLKLYTKSTFGRSEEVLEAKGDIPKLNFKLHPKITRELLGKAGTEASMSLNIKDDKSVRWMTLKTDAYKGELSLMSIAMA